MKSEKYEMFGWIIHRNILSDGEQFEAIWKQNTPIDDFSNNLFWTKGERVVTSYPETFTDEFFIQQRGKFSNKETFKGYTYKRGKYVFKAVNDTEVWCLDYLLNNSNAPDLKFVLLASGQTYELSVGQLILIASGKTNFGTSPIPLEVISTGKSIIALEETCLIIFSRVK